MATHWHGDDALERLGWPSAAILRRELPRRLKERLLRKPPARMRLLLGLLLIVASGCVLSRPVEVRLSPRALSSVRVYPEASLWLFESDGRSVQPERFVEDLRVHSDSVRWRYMITGRRAAAPTSEVHAFGVEMRGGGAATGLFGAAILGGGSALYFSHAAELDCQRAVRNAGNDDVGTCGFQVYQAVVLSPLLGLAGFLGGLVVGSERHTVRYVLNPAR
jgi:hypothetical protein